MSVGERLVTFGAYHRSMQFVFYFTPVCIFFHSTSYASRLDVYGDFEFACILKYIPMSLASCRSLPKTPLVVAVLLV